MADHVGAERGDNFSGAAVIVWNFTKLSLGVDVNYIFIKRSFVHYYKIFRSEKLQWDLT